MRARGRGPRGRWCDSSHLDEQVSSRSRTPSTASIVTSPGPGRSSMLISPRRCRCDSGHPFPKGRCCCCTPPFRGTGHDSAKIVGRGSTPLGGTLGFASLRLGRCRIPTPAMQRSIRWRRATCVKVWKPRRLSKPTVIRVRFPIHALSFRLVALTSGRAAVWCDSRWIVSGLSTRQLS